jgi:hypothetical protein
MRTAQPAAALITCNIDCEILTDSSDLVLIRSSFIFEPGGYFENKAKIVMLLENRVSDRVHHFQLVRRLKCFKKQHTFRTSSR